jgi:porin
MKSSKGRLVSLAVLAVVLPTAAASARASDSGGIVPIPDYSGSVLERRHLLGDWGGSRTEFASKGLQLDTNLTQVVQNVANGGVRPSTEYGMTLSNQLTVDLDRMGVLRGALFEVRLDSRYGTSVNNDSGALLPVNTTALFPLTSPLENEITTVTEVVYTQFLSPKFAVFFGKLQTLDGDPNEFAGGRGVYQFMNFNFVQNAVSAISVPYSSLGGGVLWLPTEQLTIVSNLIGTSDTSTTTGFDEINQGLTWATAAMYQYRLGELPGGVNATFVYAFASDFADIDSKLQFEPGIGFSLPDNSSTWATFVSGWQYLVTFDKAPEKINVEDGRPDVRGIGLFGRLGIADQDTNPVNWSGSIGLGARGLIPARDNDTIGVAYMYTDQTNPERRIATRVAGSTQAFEAFYNIALTPAANLTFDIQWVDGAFNRFDEATVVGVRLNLRF